MTVRLRNQRVQRQMLALALGLALALWCLLSGWGALGAAPQDQQQRLRVGVYHAPPFVVEQENSWDGVGMTLWRQVAENLDLTYDLQKVNPELALGLLASGELDLVVAAVADPEAERNVDFSHSYYTSELGAAQRQRSTIWETLRIILSRYFLRTLLSLLAVLIVVGIVFWLLERQHNPDIFGGSRGQAFWSSFWWASVTLQRPPTGEETPRSMGGRLLALVWMLVAIGLTATLTAVLTSLLTSGIRSQPLAFPDDLRQISVGAVEGANPAELLRAETIDFTSFPSTKEGMRALLDDEIDVLVHDTATLRFTRADFTTAFVEVRSLDRLPQHYAIALPEESPLLEDLNHQILTLITQPGWQQTLTRYIP